MELVLNIVRRMVKPWLSLMLLLHPFFNRSSMQFKLLSITARNKMVLPFAPVASTLAPVQKNQTHTNRYLIGWCYSLLFMAMPLPCVQLQLITCCRSPKTYLATTNGPHGPCSFDHLKHFGNISKPSQLFSCDWLSSKNGKVMISVISLIALEMVKVKKSFVKC